MKSVPKLIRRFVRIMLFSFLLLLVLNAALLALYVSGYAVNSHPWQTADDVASHLHPKDHGYILSEDVALELEEDDAWAILIDNETMQVIWQTENLPESVPNSYSASAIAGLTRGYIDGYPTFTGESEQGLVVLGYPKDRFWKHMWPSWDYEMIASFPKTMLSVLALNLLLIFLIYAAANSRLLKSIRPIVNGIQKLPAGEPVYIPEKGLLSELAASINRTSEILQAQTRQLRKKENARANWIAGVSHDIRTPLSMVMGYAGQLKDDPCLADSERQKAAVIVRQSERMRNLINDLNLASRLEYNMQPIHPEKQNIIALVRQVAVAFINMDLDGKYPIAWETDESMTVCMVNADGDLLKRAVSNLIQNCISHNEQGCHIYVNVMTCENTCTISVDDDGTGASDEQIERLNHAPHYMVCDENTSGQRHGLGLLIVRQIAAAHGGTAAVVHSARGGFSVRITLPASVY